MFTSAILALLLALQKWLAIRANLFNLIPTKGTMPPTADELTSTRPRARELANEAISEIYKDMGTKAIEVEPSGQRNPSLLRRIIDHAKR